MHRIAPFALLCSVLALAACSGAPVRASKTFPTGEKATVGKLVYSVVDTQIFTRLGEEPNPRLPQNRFYVVQVSASNSGNEDASIPAMTLTDDAGKAYEELTDGTGVSRWLGVIRRVGANQTESGNIVFDAPASHYKLKLTDETDASDVYIDIPLSFAHEQMSMGTEDTAPELLPGAATGTTTASPAKPKKK